MTGGPIPLTRDSLPIFRFDERLKEETRMTISQIDLVRTELLTDRSELRRLIEEAVHTTPVIDVHTHLFPPEFDGMCLFGIDELLTYHYLVAELFRTTKVAHASFWEMSRADRADLVWKTLFVDNTPLSEAARGVITILDALGLDTRPPDLREARSYFRSQEIGDHIAHVLDLAHVSGLVMTNDPFDVDEARHWNNGIGYDERFHAALRLDALLNDWEQAAAGLAGQGLEVDRQMSGGTTTEVRRFLDRWIDRARPLYLAASLPAEFKFPAADLRDRLLREVVLPVARDHGLAVALMIGVRRGVNPALRDAGDGVGRADLSSLERLCGDNPDVRFLATLLSRENQHELCVVARKFNNLMPFGCWWFLNNPSLVSEITSERLELLGPSFIPQHSDARVLEQLIYKWQHSRAVLAEVIYEAYERLLDSGRAVTRDEITRDVSRMFQENFRDWVGFRGS
jgi:hypothetical protein